MSRLASLVSLCLALAVAGCAAKNPTARIVRVAGGSYTDVTAQGLHAMLKEKDELLINVHIPFAGNIPETDLSIPYDQIQQSRALLPADKNSRIILYCRSGHMSTLAAEQLASLGYTNIWNLEGGMQAWEEAGYPIEK